MTTGRGAKSSLRSSYLVAMLISRPTTPEVWHVLGGQLASIWARTDCSPALVWAKCLVISPGERRDEQPAEEML